MLIATKRPKARRSAAGEDECKKVGHGFTGKKRRTRRNEEAKLLSPCAPSASCQSPDSCARCKLVHVACLFIFALQRTQVLWISNPKPDISQELILRSPWQPAFVVAHENGARKFIVQLVPQPNQRMSLFGFPEKRFQFVFAAGQVVLRSFAPSRSSLS